MVHRAQAIAGCFRSHVRAASWRGRAVLKLYRINKLAKPGGVVVKKIDVLANNDAEAVRDAAESDDCPVCDVLRDGKRVGSIQ